MKKLIIIFLFIPLWLNATTYYVSYSDGSDSFDGTSINYPWRTISKVNSWTFPPGDKILFKRGDVWYETLVVSSSGTSANRITYGAYGSGNNPRISGFTTVSGWTIHSGSVYRAPVSASSPNILTVDGENTPMGRYPNSSSSCRWQSSDLTIDSYTYNSITDAALPVSPDLDGAQIVLRTAQWITETKTVNHDGNTLTLTSGSWYYDSGNTGRGYFVRNHLALLDATNEWYHGGGYLYIYGNPSGKTVKISTRSNLVEISSKDYITLENLCLEGANSYAVYATNSDYLIVDGCEISFGGNTAIYCESYCVAPTIQNCDISNINNYGIVVRGVSNATIEHNDMNRIGYINGAGGSGDEDYTAIVATGYNGKIRYNRLRNVGYSGIRFGGQNTLLSYNFLDSICVNKSDGAGFYTYRDYNTGKLVDHNVIMHCLPQQYGWPYYDNTSASAVYTDGAYYTTFTNNVFANCANGMFINCAQSITTENNLCYDNTWGMMIMSQKDGEWEELARYHDHSHNIYFARYSNQISMYFVAKGLGESEITLFGNSDYNYFMRPIDNDDYINTQYYAWGQPIYEFNLSEWQSASGKDANSYSTPVTVSSDAELHFVYNDSLGIKYYTITGTLKDHQNNTYTTSMSLEPFTGIVLMGSGSVTEDTGVPPPVPDGVFFKININRKTRLIKSGIDDRMIKIE